MSTQLRDNADNYHTILLKTSMNGSHWITIWSCGIQSFLWLNIFTSRYKKSRFVWWRDINCVLLTMQYKTHEPIGFSYISIYSFIHGSHNTNCRPYVSLSHIQYIPRNMHTVFALLCFVVVIHWLIFPYPSGLLHWHCGNLTIAPVPAKQPW